MKALTQRNPLNSAEPMHIARSVLRAGWTTPLGHKGLLEWRGEPWEWYGGTWVRRDAKWLDEALWMAMEDAHIAVRTTTGMNLRRLAPTVETVRNVGQALRAITRMRHEEAPAWLGTGDGPDGQWIVSFQDVMVDARTLETSPRSELWFEPHVLSVGWEPDAECPTWEACVEEWSEGDPAWKELLARSMGYMLLPNRSFQRWLLMHGKVRGGKGTIMGVVKLLMGGAVKSASVAQLAQNFGLWGMESSRVLNVAEFGAVNSREGELAAATLKNIVGGDPITIDRKYMEPLRDVRIGAFPVVQSNEIPKLPNRGQGLASKMLVLPFTRSFLGKEDLGLATKLEAELPGIAVWALKGAQRLLGEADSAARWPVPRAAEDAVERFSVLNAPMQEFLDANFEACEGGFVSTTVLWARWQEWKKTNGLRDELTQAKLLHRVVEESSWMLQRARLGSDRLRGLRGLRLPLE